MDQLFGRQRELSLLVAALERAEQGHGSLALLTGEAGIGKSRLCGEIAAVAEQRGATVAWGRAWEAGGAPAFWPWTQMFRALGRDPFGAIERSSDASQRFLLFDAATRALADVTRETPTVLLLDDLHVADVPSLLLLLFVARELGAMRLLVVGAAREQHPWPNPEIGALLGQIRREAEVLRLPRLTLAEVTAWTASRSAAHGEQVYRASEGNPLFVDELLRVGLQPGALHGALEGLLGQHVARLSSRARVVLEAASVLGREFSLETLSVAFAFHPDEVAQDTNEAVAIGVLAAGERGSCLFSHALLRDHLYESLAPTRRAELHWRAGTALAHGATAAHHLLAGSSAGNWEAAARVARDAAQAALAQLGYEEAAALAQRALAVIPGVAGVGCELELLRAEALFWTGKADEARALCRHAASLATELDSPELIARAALVYGTEFISASVDDTMVGLLDAARERLPAEPSTLRARVMVRLAAALMPPLDEATTTRIIDMARASLAMARELGDKETLIYACGFASSIAYLVGFDERAAIAAEAVTLARELGHRLTLERLSGQHIVMLVEQGRRAEANVELRAFEGLTQQLPPAHRWRLLAVQSVLALLDGRFDAAALLSDQSRALGGPGSPAETMWGLQRAAIAQASGDPASIAPDAEEVLRIGTGKRGTGPSAWTLAALGKPVEASAALASSLRFELGGFPGQLWAGSTCVLARDAELAARVYPVLQRESSRMFWGAGGSSVFGPRERVLGDLALLLGRRDEASAYYDQAIAHCRLMGAKPLLELSLRGRDACGAPLRATKPEPTARQVSMRREGELWVVESDGSVVRLKHGKGAAYLEQLVLHAGRELHVLVLVGVEHGTGDAGAILDARAKVEYQRRIELLDERIELARSLGDDRGLENARSELDALAEQLAAAVGLGGRDRRAASDVERARINVQRRLKDTIESIAAVDAVLGGYLRATVRTGTFCSFLPC